MVSAVYKIDIPDEAVGPEILPVPENNNTTDLITIDTNTSGTRNKTREGHPSFKKKRAYL